MNPKRLLLFTALFFCLAQLHGQDTLPPVYELRVDTTVEQIPDQYWQMIEDPRNEFKFPAITRTKGFHSNTTRENGFGFNGVKTIWLRMRFKNNTGKDQEMIFGFPPSFRNDLWVMRANGETSHLLSGWGVAFNKRDTFRTRNGILVPIANQEQITVYRRVQLGSSEFNNEFRPSFSFVDTFVNRQYIQEPFWRGDTRSAFIAGVLILGFFLNFFFFWIVKEKVYLYYSLLLLIEGIWYLSIGTMLFFKNNPALVPWIDLILTFALFFFCVQQFVRYFLKTFHYYPKWDKILVSLGIITLVIHFSRLFIHNYLPFSWRGIPGGINQLFFFLWMFGLLVTFFFKKVKKDRFTILAIIAAFPAFFEWSVLYGITNLFDFLDERYGIVTPSWLAWLNENDFVIEMFCVGWFAVLFTWILLQRYSILRKQFTQQELQREKEKADLMQQQTIELEKQVEARTAQLKQSIEDLKATQQQLIHSEKMASLGELTAGIAHEIQNPLNFVNNFSEVNKELIAEMRTELEAGNIEAVNEISRNIEENEEKIVVHGKRADAIVKSMLQHSRLTSGTKEPTDINALADEYLRLAFHGLRAKDKSFNAKFEAHLDPSVGEISVVKQDIGRVLLNLINNAFYAVTEKKKTSNDQNYDPIVIVTTKKAGDKILISVKDNGNGIPKQVQEKIFLPFFTTKPAGEGTGLGLSLAYDIITKGHGGELKLETSGQGTEFMIVLPLGP
jgi:two-component system, NtrC family, sensor kinase